MIRNETLLLFFLFEGETNILPKQLLTNFVLNGKSSKKIF